MSSYFQNPSKGKLSEKDMISEISKFIEEEPDVYYRLVIGTDSQLKYEDSGPCCDFVTAIVIHRSGRGARYFWRKQKHKGTFVLRDKIYTETQKSLDTAHTLVPRIRQVISGANYDLEIHIDVGSLGPTRDMLREVVGMVSGSGFTAKTKPESWGASSVADKHT